MSRVETSWDYLAKEIGYSSEYWMLVDLYVNKYLSLKKISQLLQVDHTTVRKRLLRIGVKMREKGGARKMPRLLAEVSSKELFDSTVSELVTEYDVHPSTVSAERRRRRFIPEP